MATKKASANNVVLDIRPGDVWQDREALAKPRRLRVVGFSDRSFYGGHESSVVCDDVTTARRTKVALARFPKVFRLVERDGKAV